jgi:hypothetical protein
MAYGGAAAKLLHDEDLSRASGGGGHQVRFTAPRDTNALTPGRVSAMIETTRDVLISWLSEKPTSLRHCGQRPKVELVGQAGGGLGAPCSDCGNLSAARAPFTFGEGDGPREGSVGSTVVWGGLCCIEWVK